MSICTANHTHADIAVAALAAGKYVLCEKPMATSIEASERMVLTVQKSSCILIGHNQRFAEGHVISKENPAKRRLHLCHSGPEN